MAIIDILSEDVIKIGLESTNKYDAIRELIAVLKKAGKISEPESVNEAILKRESQGSTGLEMGIAVPHAKCPQVRSLTVAIGTSAQGIDFDSLDGKPAKLFFLILAPPDQSGPHIEALAEIARMARSTSFCDMILRARTAKEIIALFREE